MALKDTVDERYSVIQVVTGNTMRQGWKASFATDMLRPAERILNCDFVYLIDRITQSAANSHALTLIVPFIRFIL